LGDAVINAYLGTIRRRCDAKVTILATQFMDKLQWTSTQRQMAIQNADGAIVYSRVRRWTRHINIFDQKRIIVPINQGNVHWAMAWVDMTCP
jgi:Ulp1 family protease